MHRKVTIGEGEHFRVDDVSNLAAFPQEGDEVLTQDWLGTLRYRGLTVTKDGANAVVVAPGSAYVAFRQFALADPVSVSLVDEKPLIAGQKRVVVLAAQGAGDRPAAAVPRDKTVDVPDGNGGSVSGLSLTPVSTVSIITRPAPPPPPPPSGPSCGPHGGWSGHGGSQGGEGGGDTY